VGTNIAEAAAHTAGSEIKPAVHQNKETQEKFS
jgi:hypothetical protein